MYGCAGSRSTFPATAPTGREMDFPKRPAKERAAQYEREAQKFLKMANVEPSGRIREQLASLAEQYNQLAASLRKIR
jgi:hypothetical protein